MNRVLDGGQSRASLSPRLLYDGRRFFKVHCITKVSRIAIGIELIGL
jgi:hypothetical protein